MRVTLGINHLKPISRGSVLTIGVFDGVHIGHRRVIARVVREARRRGLESVVVTFDPNPAKITRPDGRKPSIISLAHRIRLIREMGVERVVVLRFTKRLAAYTPERFVKDILVRKLAAREIIVSDNFYFARGAAGGIDTLRRLSKRYGFSVRVVKAVRAKGRTVSSSFIRKHIVGGDIAEASRFLGRPLSVLGTVVSGARLARELGYPTANINPHHEAIPPSGVYAVLVRLKDSIYNGILNIGVRPTFYAPRDREPAIEVHMFGFSGVIYGRDVEVFFIKRIRDEKAFPDEHCLIGQIKKDEKVALAVLRGPGAAAIKKSLTGGAII